MVRIFRKCEGGKIQGIYDRFVQKTEIWRQRLNDGKVMAQEIVAKNEICTRDKYVQLFQRSLVVEASFSFKCLSGIYSTDMIELAAIGFKVQ
ncbi:hypothetical protein GURASL_16030 [Geotalea uraniireducens]|uniref:Uncharacterized protein n=1 Tax=Geotalea uraniireducens TaxID=351604 RepID=A0ABN6VU45_9BACT|nr:hypothetical protein GURASL_16030 [Geotalea uraniireducens]